MIKIFQKTILLGLIIYSLFATTSTSLQTGGICLGILALIPIITLDLKRIKNAPFNLPIIAFIITLILSSLFSQSPIDGFSKTESIIRKILVYYLVIVGISDIKWAKRLIYILLIGAGIGVIYYIIKWQFGFYGNLYRDRSLGGALGILLPISLCLCLFSKFIHQKICFGIISFLFLTLLLLTSTRGAWIGVIIAIIFIGILKDKKAWLLIPLFLLYGIVFPKEITNRVVSTFDLNYNPNLCRIYLWKEALKTIKKNPIIGIGPNFKTAYMGEIHSHYHNNFLNIATSCGLLGLLVFIWLIMGICGYAVKSLQNKSEESFFLKLGIFASLIDWFIHGMVDTTYIGNLGYLFWFFVGMIVVINKVEYESK